MCPSISRSPGAEDDGTVARARGRMLVTHSHILIHPCPSGSGRQAFYSASAPPRRPSLDLHGFLKVGRVLPLPGHGGPVRWSPAPPWFLRAGAGARRDFSIGRLGRSGGSLDPALPPVGVGTCRVGVNVGQPSCNVIIVEESCVRPNCGSTIPFGIVVVPARRRDHGSYHC